MLVVSGFWPTEANSISGIFVVQQVAALARSGCRITVIVPQAIGRRNGRLVSVNALGLDVSRISLLEFPFWRTPDKISSCVGMLWLNCMILGVMFSRFFCSHLPGQRFDGCLIHGERCVGLSLPFWHKHINGRSVVVIHGVDPFWERGRNYLAGQKMFQEMCEKVVGVVLVGHPLMTHAKRLGIPKDKIKVIGNGTDLPPVESAVRKQQNRNGAIRILSVSNLVPLKGIDDNIRALAHLASERPDLSWRYHIVGEGRYREKLEALVRETKLSDRVKFLGRLSYAGTMQEMDEAGIFSLPSWGEAFGIVYLEAMARLKPVIGCLENGAAEIITNGQDGLLISPRSIPQLAEALSTLMENPELCDRIGKAARLTAEKFSWDKNAEHILELLGFPSRPAA